MRSQSWVSVPGTAFNDHYFVYSIYFRLEVKSSILLTCTTFSFLSTDPMKMNVEFTIKLGT